MKVTHASLADLAATLTQVMPAVPPKSTLYVLEHLRLVADGDTLELTATDTELTIAARMPAHVAASGALLVPARRFYDVVRALPEQDSCTLTSTDTKLILETEHARYEFPTLPPEEFPETATPHEASTITLPSTDAHLIASCVAYAASTEQYRPAMTGVKFEIDDSLTAVATDGYRLAMLSLAIGGGSSRAEAIVPARVVELLGKTEGDVTIGFSNTHVIISTTNANITARLIDEAFPEWRNVLPRDNTKHATINRQELLRAVKRVALFTTASSQLVRFHFESGSVLLTVTDVDTGAEAQERVECSYDSEPFDIGFNAKFITEALAHLPSELAVLKLSNPTRAVLITPAGDEITRITKLVMPMRL